MCASNALGLPCFSLTLQSFIDLSDEVEEVTFGPVSQLISFFINLPTSVVVVRESTRSTRSRILLTPLRTPSILRVPCACCQYDCVKRSLLACTLVRLYLSSSLTSPELSLELFPRSGRTTLPRQPLSRTVSCRQLCCKLPLAFCAVMTWFLVFVRFETRIRGVEPTSDVKQPGVVADIPR